MEAKSIKNQLQNDIQDSIPKFNPLWPENQTQDTSKTLPRRPHDAQKDPGRSKTSPRRPQDASKTTPRRLPGPRRFKILSRRPQDGSKPPKTPQNASKTPQDASKTPPRRLQTSISGDVSSMFGQWLMDFGLIFEQFFIDLFHCISVMLLRSWRGGGYAALLRVG